MRTWQLTVQLVDDGQLPVFRQIAASILADIERGRLRPGERLPSSRALCSQLSVNRNTVLAAYEELFARGVIRCEPAKGTFVSGEPVREHRFAERAGFDLPAPTVPDLPARRASELLVLLGGVPELRFLPHVQLARAYRSALEGAVGGRLVDYADPQGDHRLRVALGDLLARARGIPAGPEAICVTRGSQGGLYLAARALLRPGDIVAVEEYGFEPAWQALRLNGVELRPMPVDQDGLDVDALEQLCSTHLVRAVYLTPHHQYPTTVTLSAERRRRLMQLAARHRIIIFEDDYDYDFHYDGRPVLPLASFDPSGVVIYFGTMSKSLAPGLRLGYMVAPPDVIQRVAAYRMYVDRQGDHVLERAVATLLEDGLIQQHTRHALRAYRRRRDALCEALGRHLPQLEIRPPSGGMALWVRAPGIDVEAWARRSLAAGVAFQGARRFTFDGAEREYARMGFAACNESELDEAARRLATTLHH
ncbi:PLP-dependent aminotransferase family protein [Pendulispora brunnea]|uniref:PLP-dependent aminotransferase family protein n=1 Tax=Pendulispora brunnea TaxID=2905690 RepID=A0ABZ2JZ49_9BACT